MRTAEKKTTKKRKRWKKRKNKLQARLHAFRLAMRRRFRPRVVTVHGVRVPTDPALLPAEIIDLIYEGRYERSEAELCRQVLRADDRVLELGGGIGFIGSLCAQICGSDRVLTYEANARVEGVIRRTHKLNRVSPLLRMRAVNANGGEATFFVNDNIISSSLVDREFGGEMTVPCDSLSAILGEFRPTVIVADIEGAEVDVLPSAGLATVERMVIELHPKIVGDARNETLIAALEEQGLFFESGVRSKVAYFARRPCSP